MSTNLDKSLDELVSTRRQRNRRGSARRPGAAKSTKPTVPVGGVQKTTKTTKVPGKNNQSGRSSVLKESKIIVSGLPSDVNEANIKEYFSKSAGPVKRVMLTYNQNGTSRGIASIVFSEADTAAKAAKELNGLLVDNRPMKIEVVVDASHAPEVAPPKPLTERIVQAKSQPRPATATKAATTARGRFRGRGGTRRGRYNHRPKPKSVEELDADMVDYWANENADSTQGAPAATNGETQPTANGSEEMMAEIS